VQEVGHAAREVVESVTANAKKGSKKAQMPQMSGGKGMTQVTIFSLAEVPRVSMDDTLEFWILAAPQPQ